MTGSILRLVSIVAAAMFAAEMAHAQFALYRVNGQVELPVPALCDLGSYYSGETAVTLFRLRNVSNTPGVLGVLTVAGAGFSMSGPAVPLTLAPSAAVEFAITFQAGATGSYSATLDMTGVSSILVATVAPGLTYSVVLPQGPQQLSGRAVDFGTIPVGSAATVRFVAANQTGLPLIVPAIAVQGDDFALAGASPSGSLLQPSEQTGFDVMFQPRSGGPSAAVLLIGDRSYPLAGSAPAPPLPKPAVSVSLPEPRSGQQGSVQILFDVPATAPGTGILTLAFQPATSDTRDSAIIFSTGTNSIPFAFSAGDTQAYFGDRTAAQFQTGTSAGTLLLLAVVGANTAQQSIHLDAAAATITSVSAARGAGSVTVQVAGYDNTRSASQIVFRFFDIHGNVLAPGEMICDTRSLFASYYASSDLGGLFQIGAAFPVTGDSSVIQSVTVQLTNSVGASYPAAAEF